MPSLKRLILLFISISVVSYCYGQTEQQDFKADRFSASIGGFYTGLNSNVIVGIDELGIGLSLELEDALGLESSVLVLRGNATYTFGKNRNKRLALGYIGLLRKSEITLGQRSGGWRCSLPLIYKDRNEVQFRNL